MSSFVTAGGDIGNGELLAQNAQDTANTNATGIKNINDPNYLSPFEKPQLEIQMDNFATIYTTDKNIATAEGIDFSAYEAAYQAYVAYMTPLIADMTTYSPIVRSTFNSMVTAVQVEQKRFNTATQAQYNQQMNQAQTDIANGQTKYEALQSEAKIMESSAAGIADKANRLASKYDDTNSLASQALGKAESAQIDASSAISKAESAASDSKDAKQIAGAVSQSYKTLTDGSTMTIAELEGGLAVKLTKTDLNGYATQDWSQNQIKMTADGINGTMSSIKNTVDSQTTSINDLKADSNGFRDQFTTVTNTLGTQTTDISTLQASSKELTSGFNTLTTENGTNKNDISQLKQTATEVTSTLETVQTQVQNSAVGTNLLTGTSNAKDYTLSGSGWALGSLSSNGTNASIPCTPGESYTYSVIVKSTTYDCYPEMQFLDSGKNFILNSANFPGKDIGMRKTTEVAPENAAFVVARMVLKNPPDSQTVVFNSEKLEKGSMATDWSANPADNATVTAVSSISQTIDKIQTDVRGKVDNDTYQADVKVLNNQITSVVGKVNNLGQRNLVYNSELSNNTDGWESNVPLFVGTNQWDHTNGSNSLVLSPHGHTVGDWSHAYSKMVPAIQGMKYSASGTMFVTGPTPPTGNYIGLELTFFDDTGNRVDFHRMAFDISKPWDHQFLKTEGWVAPANATKVCLAIQMNGDANIMLNHPMMVAASTVGAYLPDTADQSQITQLKDDIDLRVKKGDVVNQFNLDAGGALLSTSGNSTKIVFSSPNIIFDSNNPVQIPNANIPGKLTGKTIEASKITGDTKITGADIEAPIIHSPSGSFKLDGNSGDIIGASIHSSDNSWVISKDGIISGSTIIGADINSPIIHSPSGSFKLDGNTGDIIGASIHSADNSWGIDKNGKINGVDIKIGGTYSYVGTGSGQVHTGAIYNELDSVGYHQWTSENDHVRINNGVITITNDADEKANANVEGIPLGVFISEGNTQFTGSLKIGNIYTNGVHTINSIDGGGIFFEDGMGAGNSMVDIYTGNITAYGTIKTGNIMIGNSHSITMNDGAKAGTMYFDDSSGSQSYALKAKSFSQSSLLSLKTDITEIDPHEALVELVKNDFMSYHYKNDKSNDPKTVSVILDDINPIPKYYTSDIFKSADGTGRNDGNVVGYLALSVKDLNNREIADKARINDLENRLQKLEGAN